MRLNFFSFLMLLFALPAIASAQDTYKLVGNVTAAENGIPIPGINVIVVGENRGTVTDFDGNFLIEVATGDVLQFSYVGRAKQRVTISGQNNLAIALEPDAAELDEIVVIGYGTQKKSSVTGAVAKLENKNLDELPNSNVINSFKGKIAGVQVTNASASVGEQPQITIRGTGSISLSSEPLVVVDGFPFEDGLEFIDPSTIESIEVLKDASSTAIYGSRGANGVILVTTKSGSESKAIYEFKTFTSFKKPFRTFDRLSEFEKTDISLNQRRTNARLNGSTEEEIQQVFYSSGDIYGRLVAENSGGETDWYDEVTRNVAVVQNYQLSASGGSGSTKYYVNGSYIRDEGFLKDNDLERFNFRAKLDTRLKDNLKLNVSINPSYTKTQRSTTDFSAVGRFQTWLPARHNAFTSEITGEPIGSYSHPVHYRNLAPISFTDFTGRERMTTAEADGGTTIWTSRTFNPLSGQEESQDFQFDYRTVTNASLEWEIVDDLKWKSSANAYLQYRTREEFDGRLGQRSGVNAGVETGRLRTKYVLENTLNYKKKFGSHRLDFLAGITFEDDNYKFSIIEGSDFAIENVKTLNNASLLSLVETGTTKYKTLLSSYLGRINYGFDNRYLLSIAARYDGFSKFGPDNRFGLFPSASVGWNIGNERFWKNNIGFINQFKIRQSVGISGNNQIELEDFPASNLLFSSNYSIDGALANGFGETGSFLGNREIGWETLIEYNTGIELGFFKNRVNLVADYYYKVNEDLLLRQPVSFNTGFNSFFNNIGKLENTGLELALSTSLGNENFSWSASANIAFNQNRLISLGGTEQIISTGERSENYIARVGDPYIQFYGFRTDGIWQNEEQIDAYLANNPNPNAVRPVLGSLRQVDINGDGDISADDRTVLGNPFPDFTWGITNTFNFKNFDLNFTFQGSQGAETVFGEVHYNGIREYLRPYNENVWFNPEVPSNQPSNYEVPWIFTDYSIADASYISLREVILGYTIPEMTSKKLGLKKARIYVSGQNLMYLVADDYFGLNPEGLRDVGNALITGYQRGVTPVPQQVAVGLDINF